MRFILFLFFCLLITLTPLTCFCEETMTTENHEPSRNAEIEQYLMWEKLMKLKSIRGFFSNLSHPALCW
jgi:hypothetical protein